LQQRKAKVQEKRRCEMFTITEAALEKLKKLCLKEGKNSFCVLLQGG